MSTSVMSLAHAHKQSSRATAVAPAANQRCSARVRRDIWVMAGEDSLQCLTMWSRESDWPISSYLQERNVPSSWKLYKLPSTVFNDFYNVFVCRRAFFTFVRYEAEVVISVSHRRAALPLVAGPACRRSGPDAAQHALSTAIL